MAATVRIGVCSWADEGLLKAWYPRGVSTAEKRLRYYAERFDVGRGRLALLRTSRTRP